MSAKRCETIKCKYDNNLLGTVLKKELKQSMPSSMSSSYIMISVLRARYHKVIHGYIHKFIDVCRPFILKETYLPAGASSRLVV